MSNHVRFSRLILCGALAMLQAIACGVPARNRPLASGTPTLSRFPSQTEKEFDGRIRARFANGTSGWFTHYLAVVAAEGATTITILTDVATDGPSIGRARQSFAQTMCEDILRLGDLEGVVVVTEDDSEGIWSCSAEHSGPE